MREVKHTKGKWGVKKYKDGIYGVGIPETDDQVALVQYQAIFDEEAAANAALIAAAPDMLELLQTIIEGDWQCYNIEDVARKIVDKATTPL